MIDPSLRLRRAIHLNSPLLVSRILRTHPHLLQNPDSTPTSSLTPSLTSAYTGTGSPIGLSNTSLHLAAYLNHVQIVRLLLELGHEANGISLNEEYQTPLILAAREGHTDVVVALCKNNIGGIERRDLRGRDAVMWAATGGWDTCVQLLLTAAPAPPYRPSAYTGQLSRFPIINEKDPCSIDSLNPPDSSRYNLPQQYLLNQTSLLNQTDVDGNTALHFAAANGRLEVVNTLLAAGARADKKNVWSWTPIAYSATSELEAEFKKLLATEVNRRDGKDKTNKMDKLKVEGNVKRKHNLKGGDVRMVTAE